MPFFSQLQTGNESVIAEGHPGRMSVSLDELRESITGPIQGVRFSGPEFLDADGVELHFGLKKSLLYRLLTENRVRAVSIRKRGSARGKRLFDCSSIRAFLNSNVDKEGDAR